MKRILCACLLAAIWACSGFEPEPHDPGFGSLTGDWEGWYIILDSATRWHLSVVEAPTGEVAGNVVQTHYWAFPTPDSIKFAGVVRGRHEGSDVVLVYTYENGDRHRFEGIQVSDTTFVGKDESHSDHKVEFVRVPNPSGGLH